jgi:hypothetical protein
MADMQTQTEEVTDPALIAQLNAMSTSRTLPTVPVTASPIATEEVTDPSLLSQLNSNNFDLLVGIESGGKQVGKDGKPLTSKAGAIGIAQVMPATAPEAARLAGLPFSEKLYREDKDYNYAIGQAYFTQKLNDFSGDFFKASAAYNSGKGTVDLALKREQQTGKPWYNFLPKETKGYINSLGFDGKQEILPANATTPARQAEFAQKVEDVKNMPATYEFDPNVVKGAAAIGGVIGMVPALATGRTAFGVLKSAVGGATSGGASSLAAEYYLEGKPQNFQNDIVGLGIEMAGGAAPTILNEAITRGSTALTKQIPIIGEKLGAFTKAITGGETESEWALRRFALGNANVRGGVATDIFRTGNQKENVKRLTDIGLVIDPKLPASKSVRTIYENTLDDLTSSGLTFGRSAQMANVENTLAQGVDAGLINSGQAAAIVRTLKSQSSGVVSPKAYASMIDELIHSPKKIEGLSEATDRGSKFIKDTLSSNYDDYFAANTGKPLYSLLKGVEESEVVAKSRDSIPVLLDTKFKASPTYAEDLEQALRNIKKSAGGPADLKAAVVSYFKALPEKEAVTRFNDLSPIFEKTKILSLDEIYSIKRGVNLVASKRGKAAALVGVTAKDAILGALGAEAQRTPQVREMFGNKPSNIEAFSF